MNTVVYSDYTRGTSDALITYMEKENATLRDRTGREMSDERVQELIDASEHHQMTRHFVISPENAQALSNQEMQRVGKEALRDTLGDRVSVDYGYCLHDKGGDRPHIHAVATGRANQSGDPLWIDTDDLHGMRKDAHERALEAEQERSKVVEQVMEKSVSQELTRE